MLYKRNVYPKQRSNTHGAVSLFRKKLICRALSVSAMPKPCCVMSVFFLTCRHYVARMFARFIKPSRIFHSRDLRIQIHRIRCLMRSPCWIFNFRDESVFLSRICSQSSEEERGEKFYLFFFFKFVPRFFSPPKIESRKIHSRSMYDLMASKHLGFTRCFPHRDGFIVRCTMSHLRTLRIMLSDPNVIRCSSCNAAYWFRKSDFDSLMH